MSTVGIKSYAYCLNHAPETGSFYGGTPHEARHSGKEKEYVDALPKHLQTYEEALHYAPNQTYIGGLSYEEFEAAKAPWIDNRLSDAKRYGKFGEIMPEDEFLALISACDEFELVWLEKGFAAAAAEKLGKDPIITEAIVKRVLRTKNMQELSAIEEEVKDRAALPLYFDHKVVGCVRSGHPTDACLTAHVLMENLAGKASGVLALLHLLKNSGLAPTDLDFVIECSEEGAGDVGQRAQGLRLRREGLQHDAAPGGQHDGVPDRRQRGRGHGHQHRRHARPRPGPERGAGDGPRERGAQHHDHRQRHRQGVDAAGEAGRVPEPPGAHHQQPDDCGREPDGGGEPHPRYGYGQGDDELHQAEHHAPGRQRDAGTG